MVSNLACGVILAAWGAGMGIQTMGNAGFRCAGALFVFFREREKRGGGKGGGLFSPTSNLEKAIDTYCVVVWLFNLGM